jgi:hypothetical protein
MISVWNIAHKLNFYTISNKSIPKVKIDIYEDIKCGYWQVLQIRNVKGRWVLPSKTVATPVPPQIKTPSMLVSFITE